MAHYDDTKDTEPFEVIDSQQPMFTCPSCGRDLFKVGVTECTTGAHITTAVLFDTLPPFHREPQINSHGQQWVKCNSCHNGIDISIDQLDAVFSEKVTEEQMKIQCKIIQRPVFRCPKCRIDIFKSGISECTEGGSSKANITFCSDGCDTSEALISDITDQWSECGHCGARIEINATDLMNYYEGECSLEDLAGNDK